MRIGVRNWQVPLAKDGSLESYTLWLGRWLRLRGSNGVHLGHEHQIGDLVVLRIHRSF